jgi:hypothetical protein
VSELESRIEKTGEICLDQFINDFVNQIKAQEEAIPDSSGPSIQSFNTWLQKTINSPVPWPIYIKQKYKNKHITDEQYALMFIKTIKRFASRRLDKCIIVQMSGTLEKCEQDLLPIKSIKIERWVPDKFFIVDVEFITRHTYITFPSIEDVIKYFKKIVASICQLM